MNDHMSGPGSSAGTPSGHGSVPGPEGAYRAALEGVAVRDRTHRPQWLFTGREPLEMLKGVVTGVMPDAPVEAGGGVRAGVATYHTVLTPKGRIVADLWLWREDTGEGDVVLGAHVPASAAEPLRQHLARLLPPRMARLGDRSGEVGMLSLAGPSAAALASRIALGLRVGAEELEAMAEGGFRLLATEAGDRVMVLRSAELPVPVFDIVADLPVIRSLERLATDSGAVPMGSEAWEILRVEAGRPAFGPELGPEVIPVEAGIHDRAIDYGKGCYTGQEVIVRIRDRGRVNRHLRLLILDPDSALPAAGTSVYADGDRPRGEITTAVRSPGKGKLALAYVRREIEAGGVVRVGEPGGPPARVAALPRSTPGPD